MEKMIQVPDMADPEAAVIALVNYLYAVNPSELSDVMSFWDQGGAPDVQAARRCAEELRARVQGANTAHLIQIEQLRHAVTIAFRPVTPRAAIAVAVH